MIAGTITLFVVLLIGYLFGAAAAGGGVRQADAALRTTLDHQTTVGATLSTDPFKNVDLRSEHPDIPAARAALAAVEPRLALARGQVRADRIRLRAAQKQLASSILTLPQEAVLQQRRHRLQAALTALDNAQRALDIDLSTAAFAHPFFDAIAEIEAANDSIKRKDFAGLATHLQAAQAGTNNAIDLAKPPAVPQQFVRLLTSINFLLTDLQGIVTAAQANDAAGIQQYTDLAIGARNGLYEYDPQVVTNYLIQLFKPLSDGYRTNLEIAAGRRG